MHQNVDGALAFVLRLVSGLPLGRDRQRLVVRLLLAALIPTGVSSPAAILTWTGGGANAYWINSVNWGSAGVPTNGDTLIFPAGQPAELNTNNIAGLVLNQICFAGMGSGYDLRGNPITLTNSIMATNAAGINIIENNLILATATNLLIVVSNGASLTLDGVLSGSVGVNKAGLGTLLYQCAGNNAYTGTTLVSGGTLQFNVSGPNAVSGPLVIGDGTGDGNPTVEDLQTYEMNNLPSVTINDNGLLNLNNFSEPNFSSNLVMNVGGISTGTGTLTLPANSTITLEYFGNGPAYINGNLSLGGGTLTLQAEGSVYLDLAANVSGSANIAQNSALVCWSGTNTFTGSFTANSSEVELDSSQALGNTNNTMTLNDQALIDIAGGVNLTNQSLTVNSGGILALSPRASSPSSSPNSWQTSFILGTDCTIGLDGNNLPFTLNGPISGPGGISMYGYGIGNGGTLTLSGATANTYAGATTVGCTSYSTNTLLLDKPSGITAIPGPLVVGSSNVVRLLNDYQIDNPATPVTLADASLLDLNGYTDEVGPITMQGAQITGASSGYLTFASNITVNVSTVAQSVISVNCVLYDGTYMITNTSHLFSPDLVISGNLEKRHLRVAALLSLRVHHLDQGGQWRREPGGEQRLLRTRDRQWRQFVGAHVRRAGRHEFAGHRQQRRLSVADGQRHGFRAQTAGLEWHRLLQHPRRGKFPRRQHQFLGGCRQPGQQQPAVSECRLLPHSGWRDQWFGRRNHRGPRHRHLCGHQCQHLYRTDDGQWRAVGFRQVTLHPGDCTLWRRPAD